MLNPIQSIQPLVAKQFDTAGATSPVVALKGTGLFTAFAMATVAIAACNISVEITPDGNNWISAGVLAVPNTVNTLMKLTVTDKAISVRFKQQTACAGEFITATICE